MADMANFKSNLNQILIDQISLDNSSIDETNSTHNWEQLPEYCSDFNDLLKGFKRLLIKLILFLNSVNQWRYRQKRRRY